MTDTAELAPTLALAQRRLIASRLPVFTLGWLGATLLFVIVTATGSPEWRRPGLLLCAWQIVLIGVSLRFVRRDPEGRAVQPLALGTCIILGLSSLAFYLYLGGHEPIVAMMFFALAVTTSLLFAWRWHYALALFAGTYGPWLLTNPWAALQLTVVQGLAGLVVGIVVCAMMAEGSFRSFRAAFLHRTREHERTSELQASRDAYRDLTENASDMIWAADLDWRLTYVNDVAARHVGRAASEVVGMPVRAMLTDHPVNADLESAWAGMLAGGSPALRTVQVRPGPRFAEPRWFDVAASAVRDAQGRVVGIRGISRDVTERTRAEEELRRSKQKLRQLAQRQVHVREEERKRLGLDLHDNVCQELVGIGILIESVLERLDADAPGRDDLARVVRYLGELGDHLRGLARDLRPLQLPDLGLEGSLRALIRGMTTPDTEVTLDLPVVLPRLGDETEIAIFRIAQEALLNAVRHSGAHRIDVGLAVVDRRLRLEVRDDGRGFDPAAEHPDTLGLVSMEERALALRGDLAVESAPGGGTIVRLDCPIALPTSVDAVANGSNAAPAFEQHPIRRG